MWGPKEDIEFTELTVSILKNINVKLQHKRLKGHVDDLKIRSQDILTAIIWTIWNIFWIELKKYNQNWICFSPTTHTLRYEKLMEKKFSHSESLTIVFFTYLWRILLRKSKYLVKGIDQKLFKFNEFSLYD